MLAVWVPSEGRSTSGNDKGGTEGCAGFLAERPAFLYSIHITFLLRPSMSREIHRRVPLLSWLRLACMHMVEG